SGRTTVGALGLPAVRPSARVTTTALLLTDVRGRRRRPGGDGPLGAARGHPTRCGRPRRPPLAVG
ncbi:hypothetical protein, partial [Micromonospora sp. KC207]|uniref:hypothetical protein n=1 Tax=Micromonospora sp. KC207 TaxID=2530377 RepID=UPI001A9F3517